MVRLAELVISAFPSPEPEHQRGRKRRRSPPPYLKVTTTQIPSGESATFRGRSRHRSTSRFDTSRNTSRLRGGSLSPTRRKLLRVVKLNRHRSQSPSRCRSPNADEPSKRRRRTRSRSREHHEHAKPTEHTSFLRHEIVIRNDSVSLDAKQTD
ncbi:hypothetical protein BJ170DRAFT_245831 [Xylariales sp. AK1849]|nr:hypothetical protein BJ170DRAFT_245831 [Xylariales sp. AK1849]